MLDPVGADGGVEGMSVIEKAAAGVTCRGGYIGRGGCIILIQLQCSRSFGELVSFLIASHPYMGTDFVKVDSVRGGSATNGMSDHGEQCPVLIYA